MAALRNLTARPAAPGSDWRIQMLIRNLLWWDGHQPDTPVIADAVLTAPGIATPDRNNRNRRAVRGRDQGRPQ